MPLLNRRHWIPLVLGAALVPTVVAIATANPVVESDVCPLQRITYDQPGEFRVRIPEGCTHMAVKLWGGGGGAGMPFDHVYHTGSANRGGHGGGGGYVLLEHLSVEPTDRVTLVVGCGGPGADQTQTQGCNSCGPNQQIVNRYYQQRQAQDLPILPLIRDDRYGEGGAGGMYTGLQINDEHVVAVAAGGGGGGAGAAYGPGMEGLPANGFNGSANYASEASIDQCLGHTEPPPRYGGYNGQCASSTADGQGASPSDFPPGSSFSMWHGDAPGQDGSGFCGGLGGTMYGYTGGGGMGGCGYFSGGGGAAGVGQCRMEEVCVRNPGFAGAPAQPVPVAMSYCTDPDRANARCVDMGHFERTGVVREVADAYCDEDNPQMGTFNAGILKDFINVDFYRCANGPGGGGGGGFNFIGVFTSSRFYEGGEERLPGGRRDPDWDTIAGLGGEATAEGAGPGNNGRAVVYFYIHDPNGI